jgi:hypothetical protein
MDHDARSESSTKTHDNDTDSDQDVGFDVAGGGALGVICSMCAISNGRGGGQARTSAYQVIIIMTALGRDKPSR